MRKNELAPPIDWKQKFILEFSANPKVFTHSIWTKYKFNLQELYQRFKPSKYLHEYDSVEEWDLEFWLALTDNLDAFKDYIESENIDISKKNSAGRCLVHYAAWSGSLEGVDYLYQKNRKCVEIEDDGGLIALDFAAESGDNPKLIEFLFEKCKRFLSTYYKKEIHFAAESGFIHLVKDILKHNPEEVNLATNKGAMRKPIHYAAISGNTKLVQYLQSLSSDCLYEKDYYGYIAIHVAAHRNNLDLVKYLLKEDDSFLLAKSNYNRIPFHEAVSQGALEVVAYMLTLKPDLTDVRDDDDWTAIHFAAKSGDIEVIDLISDTSRNYFSGKHSPYYFKTNIGTIPIQIAAGHGHAEAVKKLCYKNTGQLSTLLQFDNYSNNLLHYAVESENLKVIRQVIDLECTLMYEPNKYGLTPFDKAILFGKFSVFKFFLELDAHFFLLPKPQSKLSRFFEGENKRKRHNNPIITYAAHGGYAKIVKSLITEYGQDPFACREFLTLEMLAKKSENQECIALCQDANALKTLRIEFIENCIAKGKIDLSVIDESNYPSIAAGAKDAGYLQRHSDAISIAALIDDENRTRFILEMAKLNNKLDVKKLNQTSSIVHQLSEKRGCNIKLTVAWYQYSYRQSNDGSLIPYSDLRNFFLFCRNPIEKTTQNKNIFLIIASYLVVSKLTSAELEEVYSKNRFAIFCKQPVLLALDKYSDKRYREKATQFRNKMATVNCKQHCHNLVDSEIQTIGAEAELGDPYFEIIEQAHTTLKWL